MNIKNKTILITGASGGIGSSLVAELAKRNVKKIYAGDLKLDRSMGLKNTYGETVVPMKLDVTNAEDIQLCRNQCSDIDILINNAGVELANNFLSKNALKASSIEMAVNYFGVHHLCSGFWDSLKEKKSSAIVNILSIASFSLILKLGTYCASKAAAHLLTQGLREESKLTNIKIFGVYPGYVDTEMTKNIEVEKVSPEQIAASICDSIENNILDIFPDKMSEDLSKKIGYQSYIFSDFSS